MAIVINIPTTPAQDAKLATWLETYNAQRVRQGQPPFATVNDAVEDFVKRKLKASVRAASQARVKALIKRFPDLSQSKQYQIATIAGV